MTRLDAGIDRALDELDLRSVHRSPVLDYLGRLLDEFRELDEGEVATYIPELARADPDWFGICVVTADGHEGQAAPLVRGLPGTGSPGSDRRAGRHGLPALERALIG